MLRRITNCQCYYYYYYYLSYSVISVSKFHCYGSTKTRHGGFRDVQILCNRRTLPWLARDVTDIRDFSIQVMNPCTVTSPVYVTMNLGQWNQRVVGLVLGVLAASDHQQVRCCEYLVQVFDVCRHVQNEISRQPGLPTYIISSTTIYQHALTLRSSARLLLTVPRMALALSAKAFSVSAPSVWNSLSYSCRSAKLLGTFKCSLKTDCLILPAIVNVDTQPSLCHYAVPLIRPRHTALYKCVLIDWLIVWLCGHSGDRPGRSGRGNC